MFSPYMPYSGEQGLVTNDQNVVLLLVFSEPVNGLTASSFSISGPSGATVSGLKLLRGTNTYYHFTVNLPGTYYDAVTVNLQVRLACCKMPAAVFLSHRLAILRKKRKDYATYAVALYMGDKCVEHCPPGHTHHSCTVWPGKLSPVAVFLQCTEAGNVPMGFQVYTAIATPTPTMDMYLSCLMSSNPWCICNCCIAFMGCWYMQGTVTDTAGKVNLAVSPLSFTRVAYPLLSGTSYEVIKSPGLLTLT